MSLQATEPHDAHSTNNCRHIKLNDYLQSNHHIFSSPIKVREATFDKENLLRNLPAYRKSTQEITDINSNLFVRSAFSINLSF